MAPISSTSAWRQLRWKNSGAKCRMTVAKRDGRTGMAASLGGDTPVITARSLRHSTPRKWPKSSLVALVEDPKSSVPESARGILQVLIRMLNALEEQLKELDSEIARRAKADPVARRLMTIPGIGPIAASAITALVPAPEGFRAGRDFAAWLGLT